MPIRKIQRYILGNEKKGKYVESTKGSTILIFMNFDLKMAIEAWVRELRERLICEGRRNEETEETK